MTGSAFNMGMMTLERLTELQSAIQFGTRVETPGGHRGIINYYNIDMDECRVFYDCDPDLPLGNAEFTGVSNKTRREIFKISQCRILTVEEAKEV